MPSPNSPPVQLYFPKQCTPENISLFSGFMATIPHLMAHRAKEKYNKDVEARHRDRLHSVGETTEGQLLTHAIFTGLRPIEKVTEEEANKSERSLPFCQSGAYLSNPIDIFVNNRSRFKKNAKFNAEAKTSVRARKSPESRLQRRIRYANALSAWDRVKRQEAEKNSIYRVDGDTISAILNGTSSMSQSTISPFPPKWSSHNASLMGQRNQTCSRKMEKALPFEKWLFFNPSSADLQDSNPFPLVTKVHVT
ncbi:hypothetical protein KIN20_003127 [Parelaphostrongylus tenuis]|uniref:Uncharacterized protein n=1 Tax=Parelaphostrongylus tenuis TaxID=148309 RepID=A0AAD5LWU5_PARTN|nr:hypothetical protein KIN20_003127 [Parelaphostrongylus tenuis]